MNQYVFLHNLMTVGAKTCAECQDRTCLQKEDPYCEKLQRAFRSVVVIEDTAKEDK